MMTENERGYTLVELLAVVVILGIIAVIAVLAINNIIEKSRKQAFVANALTMKSSAQYYAKDAMLQEKGTNKITYKELLEAQLIEPILDPHSKTVMAPEDTSYVLAEGEKVLSICLLGDEYNLCTNDSGEKAEIPFSTLSIQSLKKN
ncbi:type II secretion system protein [Rossellomorea arthrocnemi]|jgi:prepilin-type N-terminal cleavage/methylation domain-containing protein|uniref:type II secretion system protein n=1 Tax=Rossellomorea arthrocnemi TaxID=2769542 RepID=UPI001919DCD1|nr:prepilin-type N-terminal cleavage/methylation domain-containing protein [Rossellomorea arthrocnemi]